MSKLPAVLYPQDGDWPRGPDYGPLLGRVESYFGDGVIVFDRPVRLAVGDTVAMTTKNGAELMGYVTIYDVKSDDTVKVYCCGGSSNPTAGNWCYFRVDNRPYALVYGEDGTLVARLYPGDTYNFKHGGLSRR